MEFISNSPENTKQFAKDFLAGLSPKSGDRATVVGLYGNLGSGKTTLTQCAAEILGIAEHITSPTFVIMKTYNSQLTTNNRLKNLIHVDAYRLKNGEELRKLGFEKLLADPANLILIEWADLVIDILPPDHVKLYFEFVDEITRKISFYSHCH